MPYSDLTVISLHFKVFAIIIVFSAHTWGRDTQYSPLVQLFTNNGDAADTYLVPTWCCFIT